MAQQEARGKRILFPRSVFCLHRACTQNRKFEQKKRERNKLKSFGQPLLEVLDLESSQLEPPFEQLDHLEP